MPKRDKKAVKREFGKFVVGWIFEGSQEVAAALVSMVQHDCAGARLYRIRVRGSTVDFPVVRKPSPRKKGGKRK